MRPLAVIVKEHGTNCEQETKFAFEQAGADAKIVHMEDWRRGATIDDAQILCFPGGFSFGDNLGSGNAWAENVRAHVFDQVRSFVEDDGLVLGICNGFQVLVNLGLLPAFKDYTPQAALVQNDRPTYVDRWVHARVDSSKCVWTRGIDSVYLPVAHGEGKFYAGADVLDLLHANDQVVFRYAMEDGRTATSYPDNPNGSLASIAGVCDPSGNVLGMMPHPERYITLTQHPFWTRVKEQSRRRNIPLVKKGDGLYILENAVRALEE